MKTFTKAFGSNRPLDGETTYFALEPLSEAINAYAIAHNLTILNASLLSTNTPTNPYYQALVTFQSNDP